MPKEKRIEVNDKTICKVINRHLSDAAIRKFGNSQAYRKAEKALKTFCIHAALQEHKIPANQRRWLTKAILHWHAIQDLDFMKNYEAMDNEPNAGMPDDLKQDLERISEEHRKVTGCKTGTEHQCEELLAKIKTGQAKPTLETLDEYVTHVNFHTVMEIYAKIGEDKTKQVTKRYDEHRMKAMPFLHAC